MLSTIGIVAQRTGLSKDTLRKWESRYSFPTPSRDNLGIRYYNEGDVEKLLVIKSLINRGERIAQLSGLSFKELKARLDALGITSSFDNETFSFLLDLSRIGDIAGLRAKFTALLEAMGLRDFVISFVGPFLAEVGMAWHRGEISIAQEHLCSAGIIQTLSGANSRIFINQENVVKVLLTTPPHELHTIGLKMVESLVLLAGASPLCLDAQTPIDQILLMAKNAKVSVVAISVSAAFPLRHFRKYIRALEDSLDSGIEIWVGGAGAVEIKKNSRVKRVSLDLIGIELNRLKSLKNHSTL